MAIRDFKSQRLFVEAGLVAGNAFEATREQANYLLNVLRLSDGSRICLFNGRDGEWLAEIQMLGRKKCNLLPVENLREQTEFPSLTYCFAPLKQARLDYLIQKAVEMGAGTIQPVITEHTQVRAFNQKRALSNAIEAAEQCGIISIPDVRAPVKLAELPKALGDDTCLFFCDSEMTPDEDIDARKETPKKLAVLIGPEGGFSKDELQLIRFWPMARQLRLGPRILRADTAAVAAMALIQAEHGDWTADRAG